ncbi:hypothetical protein ACHAXT_007169 [Thalassiosira profunda]
MSARQVARAVGFLSCVSLAITLGCHALQISPIPSAHRHRALRSNRPLFVATSDIGSSAGSEEMTEDDDALLRSVDPATLQNLCRQYSLSTEGSKQDMLDRLRGFASEQAEADRRRREGRTKRVEANLEGKARHTILEEEAFVVNEEAAEDIEGYFFYTAPETEEEKKQKEEERRRQKQKQMLARESSSQITAPPPPDIKPNEKGERVVTVYSTTDKNDLTSVTSQTPMSDMSMENARYQQRAIRDDQPEESLIGGPFGDTSGSRRKKADEGQVEQAKEDVREVVRNLLATTGAPAFQDDYEEGDEMSEGSFASPYGFVGFQPERIPPDLLSQSSGTLRAGNGRALKEVLSEYELQAIGHDGMAADDKSKGGGHYREVEKVGSFLEGFRKAEERRVARETSTMLLDRLVKEGVKGLDQLLSGMVREGDEQSVSAGGEAGELNSALVRYLEEAIREQEQRVKKAVSVSGNNRPGLEGSSEKEDEADLMWNVTRGEDGTVIETIDPNNPAVGRMLREELEKMNEGANAPIGEALAGMTVQEKMLLLLKLLRDRVKVEAVIGNDEHARNLRILAYCLKAANDEEREQLISGEFANSLDALDVFSDLITASIDFAEARSNDDFMPGNQQQAASPMLDVAKLQKIQVIVERIKARQSWKAAGTSQ